MNKNYHLNNQGLSYLYLIFFLMVSLLGCKKELYTNNKLSTKDKIENVKNWYKESQNGSSNSIRSSKGLAVVLIFEPQWEEATALDINGKSVFTMPVKTNLRMLNRETQYYLVVSEVGNSYEFKTIAVKNKEINDKNLNANELYLAAFTNNELPMSIALGKEISVIGREFKMEKKVLYDNTGIHETNNTELNKINNAKREKLKLNDTKTDVTVEVTTCTEYYLVTQVYDSSDNLLYETSRYLRTECETRQIDFIDTDPNGPNGGGTSASTDSTKIILDFGNPVSIEEDSEIITTTDSIITKKVSWTFHEGNTYKFKSRESATKRLMSIGGWNFIHMEHLSHYVVGSVLGCEIEINDFRNTPDISRLTEAIMYIEYRVKMKYSIVDTPLTYYSDFDETFHSWDVTF